MTTIKLKVPGGYIEFPEFPDVELEVIYYDE